MADKNEPMGEEQEQHGDKAGDILRKERVTRRITVETIAKDLKLNVSYIKALEANEFGELPADPYVRVYLRSIANYLMLDPDEILKRFYRDRGIVPEDARKDREEKISVSLNTRSSAGGGRWIFILILVFALIGLALFAYRAGWLVPPEEAVPQGMQTEEEQLIAPEDDFYEDTLGDSLAAPLMQGADTADGEDTLSQAAGAGQDSLSLVVTAVRDSVWVHVFSDGESWRNFIYANQSREFSAADSFNLRVGSNNRLRYTVNGEDVSVSGSGVVAFKIDSDGVEKWRLSQWNRVFKERL